MALAKGTAVYKRGATAEQLSSLQGELCEHSEDAGSGEEGRT